MIFVTDGSDAVGAALDAAALDGDAAGDGVDTNDRSDDDEIEPVAGGAAWNAATLMLEEGADCDDNAAADFLGDCCCDVMVILGDVGAVAAPLRVVGDAVGLVGDMLLVAILPELACSGRFRVSFGS
jgi:nucleoside-diphosphate-sugar epimerase